jgi:hypothetical protein
MQQLLKLTSAPRALAALCAGAVAASCLASADSPPPPLGTAAAPGTGGRPVATSASIRNGDYACSIASGGHRYPAFRCSIYRAEDGSQVLEKVGGSQRFRGRVVPQPSGFSFDGTFFCPDGDCTENVTARFTAAGAAAYRGVMQGRSGRLQVSLSYRPGGFTYGGARPATPPGSEPLARERE